RFTGVQIFRVWDSLGDSPPLFRFILDFSNSHSVTGNNLWPRVPLEIEQQFLSHRSPSIGECDPYHSHPQNRFGLSASTGFDLRSYSLRTPSICLSSISAGGQSSPVPTPETRY